MLSRSCQHLRIVTKKCLVSTIPSSSKLHLLRPYQLLSYRLSSTQPQTSNDNFASFIDSVIVEKEKSQHSYAYANSLKSVPSVSVLEQFCVDSRPSNQQETLLTLQRLVSLCNSDNSVAKSDAIKFLESDDYISCLSAQLLTGEVDVNNLIEAVTCICHILHEIPSKGKEQNVEDAVSITPSFSTFFSNLMNHLLEKITSANADTINANAVARFYCYLLKHKYSDVDKNFVDSYKEILKRKIPEIELTATITTLLKSLNTEDYEDVKFTSLIFKKIEELSSDMLLGELITVFDTLADNKRRTVPLLQAVSEAIYRHTDILTPNQLFRLSTSVSKLNFFNPRLINRFCSDLSGTANAIQHWKQANNIIYFLSRAGVTNQKVWESLAEWMNLNYKVASMQDLRYCIVSLALVNVDATMIKPMISYITDRLQPRSTENPRKWLNVVSALAILNCLTPKLAESVLRKEFLEELLVPNLSASEKVYIAQKLYQVSAAAKYDLKDYKGATIELPVSDTELSICQTLKYGEKRNVEKFDQFQEHLKLFTAAFYSQPKYYPEYGVFIDGLIRYDPKSRKFMPLSSMEKNPNLPLDGLIAVLYFTPRHYTSVYSDEDLDSRRLLGEFALGVRHLKAAGAQVVVIAEHDLEKCGNDKYDRVLYVKNKIIEAGSKISK